MSTGLPDSRARARGSIQAVQMPGCALTFYYACILKLTFIVRRKLLAQFTPHDK